MTECKHCAFRPIRETVFIQGEVVPISAELVLDYLQYLGAKKATETDHTKEGEETLRMYRENLLIEIGNIPKLSAYNPSEIFDEVTSQLKKITKDLLL